MNLFYQPRLQEGALYLDNEESRHCIKVLRRRTGDPLHITDGAGTFYQAIITVADASKCEFEIVSQQEVPANPWSVHIAISPTKNNDRIEWFVEKCVEIGIDHISLIECDNTERAFVKPDRLEKVAISAMKQSLKARLPVISELQPFAKVIEEASEPFKFIAYVDHTNPDLLQTVAQPGGRYLVLVGPEGDFSEDELTMATARSFVKVSLGKSRLRTETAGVVACHILNIINT